MKGFCDKCKQWTTLKTTGGGHRCLSCNFVYKTFDPDVKPPYKKKYPKKDNYRGTKNA